MILNGADGSVLKDGCLAHGRLDACAAWKLGQEGGDGRGVMKNCGSAIRQGRLRIFMKSCALRRYFFLFSSASNFDMTSEIFICCGQTCSQLRQPTQAEGFLSSARDESAIGAMKPPPVNTCSL